eukprot:symbB.v1.2.008226.t1/scaffold497.1/size195672/8
MLSHACCEMGGMYPSQLPTEIQELLRELTRKVVLASPGLHSAFHFEALVKQDTQEVMPVELNLRVGGAECPCAVEAVTGVFLPLAAAHLALGQETMPSSELPKVQVAASTNEYASHAGIVEACEGSEELYADPAFLGAAFFPAKGASYEPLKGSMSCLCWICAGGGNAAEAAENLQRCISLCRLESSCLSTPLVAICLTFTTSMRVFFSFLLGLNATVFAKRFVESLYDREGVEVVNGREVEIIGDDVTEETGVEELDEQGQVRGDAWMKKLKVKRMKGNLSAATLPSAWKGRFELGELLGQGGFGQVYKMNVLCDGKNSSHVSAKFMRRDYKMTMTEFAYTLETQHRELQRMEAHLSEYVASTVGSPDAVDSEKPLFPGNPVLGKVMDGQWVMMPLYNGGSFKDLLRTCSRSKCKQKTSRGTKEANWHLMPGFKDINLKTVLALFENSLAGLEAIHKQGLVHMDLKPDNIMLNCKGEDVNRSLHDCFGIVIDLGTLCNKTICSTNPALVIGTRGYLPPEVMTFDPDKIYIPSNDVWAMGCVLFSLLYLDAPTFMDSYTRDKMLNYKVREDPSVPKEPSEIDQLVIDMLDTDYKKRVTLPEVRRRLRAYLEGDAEDGLNTMLSKTPSERGLAGNLPSCVNGGA